MQGTPCSQTGRGHVCKGKEGVGCHPRIQRKHQKREEFNKAADSTVSKVGDEVVRKKPSDLPKKLFSNFDLFFFSDNGAISSHFLRVNCHEWNVINKKLSHKMCSLKGIAI